MPVTTADAMANCTQVGMANMGVLTATFTPN
jgi:hypothetical protein